MDWDMLYQLLIGLLKAFAFLLYACVFYCVVGVVGHVILYIIMLPFMLLYDLAIAINIRFTTPYKTRQAARYIESVSHEGLQARLAMDGVSEEFERRAQTIIDNYTRR